MPTNFKSEIMWVMHVTMNLHSLAKIASSNHLMLPGRGVCQIMGSYIMRTVQGVIDSEISVDFTKISV